MASSHTKYHAEPRISANELARFMVSGDTGRMGIIKRAREKKSAVAIRYSDVRAAIAASMCDPIKGKQILAAAFGSFEQKTSDASLSPWSREDASKSLDVMDAFGKMTNLLKGFDFVPAPPKQPMLAIGGVDVSVNCDVLIHRPVKGVECIGAGLFRREVRPAVPCTTRMWSWLGLASECQTHGERPRSFERTIGVNNRHVIHWHHFEAGLSLIGDKEAFTVCSHPKCELAGALA